MEYFEQKPPLEVGDVKTVRIEALGSGGDGIAKVDGFVVFVPGTNVDDEVTVKITRVLKKYAFSEIVE